MIYAILAYHDEAVVTSWSADADAVLMTRLLETHRGLVDAGRLGPAARLAPTDQAVTVRGGVVLDGPFAETKEQLLGLYLAECADMDEAVATARALAQVNPTAVYEIRPVPLMLYGAEMKGAGALPL